MFDWGKRLNSSQIEAVTALEGAMLVIAGAGSGKTRVIEYRVLNLVQNNVDPGSILLLTFTRKASREMLSRAARHDPRCEEVEGGTFHSFGYKTIKKYAHVLGFSSSFSLLDEGDAEEAIHRCSTKLGLFDKEERFPRKDTLRRILSMALNKRLSVEAVLEREYPHFMDNAQDIRMVGEKYRDYKREFNYLDYDDLLIYLKALLENREIREILSERYRYVMVDEYQDTNTFQADIVYLLAEKNQNIMVVGDDAQSIYGFRGASHQNIMEFPKRFPGCKIIKLEENYRSTQPILDLANESLENMQNKYSKCLISTKKEKGVKPKLIFFRNGHDEAFWIAKTIKDFRDEGLTLGQMGVLFRSSYLSIPLQIELGKRNIPYQVFGGLRFYETAHVKDVICHLKVISTPRDELAWNRILMLIGGIGPKTSDKLIKEILKDWSLNEIIYHLRERFKTGYKFSQGLSGLISLLETASNERLKVGAQLKQVLDYYTPLCEKRFDDYHNRINDLLTLKQIGMDYRTLDQFLMDFVIEGPDRGIRRVDPSIPEEERPLILSTIHSAKGLEWEIVILLGMADGILPSSYALRFTEETEEEHRLFYVGITRAKSLLYLSMHHGENIRGMSHFNKLSRFVDVPNILSKLETERFPIIRTWDMSNKIKSDEEVWGYDDDLPPRGSGFF